MEIEKTEEQLLQWLREERYCAAVKSRACIALDSRVTSIYDCVGSARASKLKQQILPLLARREEVRVVCWPWIAAFARLTVIRVRFGRLCVLSLPLALFNCHKSVCILLLLYL